VGLSQSMIIGINLLHTRWSFKMYSFGTTLVKYMPKMQNLKISGDKDLFPLFIFFYSLIIC